MKVFERQDNRTVLTVEAGEQTVKIATLSNQRAFRREMRLDYDEVRRLIAALELALEFHAKVEGNAASDKKFDTGTEQS